MFPDVFYFDVAHVIFYALWEIFPLVEKIFFLMFHTTNCMRNIFVAKEGFLFLNAPSTESWIVIFKQQSNGKFLLLEA